MLLQQLGWEKGSADWDVIDTFVRIFLLIASRKLQMSEVGTQR